MTSSSSWYRRSLFNYKGNREYTRTGYEAASSKFIDDDLDVDCSGRHYVITGCNSGIGLQTALEVARRGGIIHMVCRNKESAMRARSEIITTTGNDKIHVHTVDFSQPRQVSEWAERFAAQHETLHVLIHNAGCMVHERRLDEDGVEHNFAVNTLALHIMVVNFMPLLYRSEDPRVVTVSSAGLLCVRLDPINLMHLGMEPFNGALVYSQNKRQQVVMTLWYAQRWVNVHFSSMHPGWADTPAVRTSIPQFYETMKDNLRTPAQGADTVVWLAISKAALKHPSGLFFQDREPVSSHLPLAWTKTSIEEEDQLVKNIHQVYSDIYKKMHPSQSAPTTSPIPSSNPPSSSSSPHPPNMQKLTAEETREDRNSAQQSESGNGSEKSQENSPGSATANETNTTTTATAGSDDSPVPFPAIPPPPDPAERIVTAKPEVAEIHSQSDSGVASQRKEGNKEEEEEESEEASPEEESRQEESKQEEKREESKQEESKQEENKEEESKQEDKQEEDKQEEESKQEDKQEEDKQEEESKQEESKQEDKQEKDKQEESKQEDKQEEDKEEESKEESKQEDKQEEDKQEEESKQEESKQEDKQEEDKQEESKREERKQEEDKQEEKKESKEEKDERMGGAELSV